MSDDQPRRPGSLDRKLAPVNGALGVVLLVTMIALAAARGWSHLGWTDVVGFGLALALIAVGVREILRRRTEGRAAGS